MIEPERLAAFIASRICHDLVSPVSSVTSALELLDEPGEQDMKPQYEDLLREGARKAAATIQFLRYAFGSAGLNAGAADMHQFKKITEEYVAGLKPSVEWDITTDHLSYSHARVMMNMFMMAVDSLPRGGVIHARVRDEAGAPVTEAPANGSLKPVIDIIPAAAYENPTWKGLPYFGRDLAIYGLVVWGLIVVTHPSAILGLEILAALAVTALFVVAHEEEQSCWMPGRDGTKRRREILDALVAAPDEDALGDSSDRWATTAGVAGSRPWRLRFIARRPGPRHRSTSDVCQQAGRTANMLVEHG